METSVDTLGTQAIAHRPRRHVLRSLVAGGAGFLGAPAALPRAEAKKKRRKRKKKRKKRSGSPLDLAYQCLGPPKSYPPDPGSVRIAQLFAPTRAGRLRRVQLAVNKESGSTGGYVVQLLTVDNTTSTPSHSPLDVIAAVTIANADVPNGESTLTAEFAGPQLDANTEYAVAIVRPGPSGPRPGTHPGPGSACAGQVFSAQDLDPFSPAAHVDLVLSVYVD